MQPIPQRPSPATAAGGIPWRTPFLSAFVVLGLLLLSACAAFQDMAATDAALTEAGYEVEELHVADAGEVTAELELADAPIEQQHLDDAARIIWLSMGERVQDLQVTIVAADGSLDRDTFTEGQLEQQYGPPGG